MIKSSVDLRGLHPQMAIAYTIACAVYQDVARVACMITSASDGKHGANSLHYRGMALDLRTMSLRSDLVQPVYLALQTALGPQFDVVLEVDHIHLEFQPKEPPKDDI